MVERANGYLETSFLPGRSFTSPADFNSQLAGWLRVANTRVVRRIGLRGRRTGGARTGPRCWRCRRWRRWSGGGRLRGCRGTTTCGSTPTTTRCDPAVVGRRVEVDADLDTVVVTCDGKVVAAHQRCWAGTRRSPTPSTTGGPALAYRAAHRSAPRRATARRSQQRDLADYEPRSG